MIEYIVVVHRNFFTEVCIVVQCFYAVQYLNNCQKLDIFCSFNQTECQTKFKNTSFSAGNSCKIN